MNYTLKNLSELHTLLQQDLQFEEQMYEMFDLTNTSTELDNGRRYVKFVAAERRWSYTESITPSAAKLPSMHETLHELSKLNCDLDSIVDEGGHPLYEIDWLTSAMSYRSWNINDIISTLREDIAPAFDNIVLGNDSHFIFDSLLTYSRTTDQYLDLVVEGYKLYTLLIQATMMVLRNVIHCNIEDINVPIYVSECTHIVWVDKDTYIAILSEFLRLVVMNGGNL